MIEDIKNKINNYNLAIDSFYIQNDDNLTVIIDSEKLHELRSCSKLLVAMAMGIAIEKDLFSLDENVYEYLEKFINNDKNREKIKQWTIRTLLTHTGGYDRMLLTNKEIEENNLDKAKMVEYALNYDIVNEPNTNFVYNNVEPFMISVLFKEKHNIDLEEYIKENIFDKLEIKEYEWERYGEYCAGATGLYLLPKDFHKIGILILNDGSFKNVQVIPANWIKEMTKIQIDTPHLVKKERVFPKYHAGYFMFISRDGFVFRDGIHGQYLLINKDRKLLISILSSEKDNGRATEMLRGIL